MIGSSTKKPWQTKRFVSSLLVLVVAHAAEASPRLVFDTRMELNSRLAYHLVAPNDLASHRHWLEFDQKAKLGDWSAVAGVRAFAEVAYAANHARYDMAVAKTESSEIVANDIYVQYKTPSFTAKIGSQQVVWGEAFGFYFADVVNPKDVRDFGLGDMNKQRITVPMVNLKHVFNDIAVQGIYIPKPFFDKTPAMGTDFGNYYASVFPQGKLSVADTRTVPLALANGEFGMRGSTTFRGMDLALFYFNYHDRSPNYRFTMVNPIPGQMEARLDGFHPRIQTLGFTLSAEQEPFLFRFEALGTFDKYVDAALPGSYSSHRTNELISVLGVDYTKITNWRLGVQLSENHLTEVITGGITPRDRPLFTIHVAGPIYREQNVELILSYAPRDGSSLGQIRYLVPVSSRIELLFGGDLLLGNPGSSFGRFNTASRGYVLLKGYLMGV